LVVASPFLLDLFRHYRACGRSGTLRTPALLLRDLNAVTWSRQSSQMNSVSSSLVTWYLHREPSSFYCEGFLTRRSKYLATLGVKGPVASRIACNRAMAVNVLATMAEEFNLVRKT
jgi:hypothetical protein